MAIDLLTRGSAGAAGRPVRYAWLALLAAGALASAAWPAPRRSRATIRYTVIQLGNLFPRASIAVTGLNNHGEVCGICYDSAGHPHGFRTAPQSPIDPEHDDLGGLPTYTDTFVTGIDDAGDVCGYCYTPSNGIRGFKTGAHAAINAGNDLGVIGSVTGSASHTVPRALSSQGYLTGDSTADLQDGSYQSHVFRTRGAVTASSDLGTFSPDPARPGKYLGYSSGMSVNDSGQVLGFSQVPGEPTHYFLSSGSKLSPADDLGDITNPTKILTAVNNQGVVCGVHAVTSGAVPFVTAPGGKLSTAVDLALLPGSISYNTTALNNQGQVVGTGRYASGPQVGEHGVLWEGNQAFDLDDLVAPEQLGSFRLNRPAVINDKGMIAGTSAEGGFAFLLVPATFADLGLSITHQPQPVKLGDDVTFTVKITNAGPSASTQTTVTAGLATGLTLLNNHPSQGTVAVANGQITWNAGPLAVSGSATLTLLYRVPGPGSYSQGAKVSGNVVDQKQANNSANDPFTVERPASADVGVTLTGAPDPVAQQDELTFTVRLLNSGPDPATNVSTVVSLPSSVTLVRSAASQGSWTTGGAPVWKAGQLNSGATAAATLVVTPTTPGALSTTADASADQPDPAKTNNHAEEKVTVLAAKLPDLAGAITGVAYHKKKKKGTKKLAWFFTGHFIVTNVGTAPSQPSVVNFVLSSDRNPDTKDRKFEYNRAIPALQPKGRKKTSKKNTKDFKLDEPLEPADYNRYLKGNYLIAIIDPGQSLKELSRANNVVVHGPFGPAPPK